MRMWSCTFAVIWFAGIHWPYHLALGASAILASSCFFRPCALRYGVQDCSPDPV
jgi:hypothetical protein